jgi:hypothetical protein
MNVTRTLLIILLALLIVSLWIAIAHQRITLDIHPVPEERLLDLMDQSLLTQRRLTAVAEQNEILTTRTLTILDRLVPTPLFTPCHQPDEPLVLYEAEPVKPAKKGKRK